MSISFIEKSLPVKAWLERLHEEYPLPAGWKELMPFSDVVSIDGFEISAVGLAACNAAGTLATGSAAAAHGWAVDRAYFELLERISIVEAIEPVVSDEVARPARSNGVAVGAGWESACTSAKMELIERDRILRSWFGEIEPLMVENGEAVSSPRLAKYYNFVSCLLADVAVVAGFPRGGFEKSVPFIYGFGAKGSNQDSVEAASRECMQRLAFLWGEEIPAKEPEVSATPDYHQELYLLPQGQAKFREWLLGGRYVGQGSVLASAGDPAAFDYNDLTPEHLRGRLCVVRASSKLCLPLYFGPSPKAYAGLGRAIPTDAHPIA